MVFLYLHWETRNNFQVNGVLLLLTLVKLAGKTIAHLHLIFAFQLFFTPFFTLGFAGDGTLKSAFTGAQVCGRYSKLAMEAHPELPRSLRHLAWLDLNSEDGIEYWNAMELMGQYAAANHACIHRHILEHLGIKLMLDVENHHNFAWKERHCIDGKERDLIVHRKGATPAGEGVLGIIPGSMATPGFLVRGKGSAKSLHSASHGAGRVMSRKRAMQSLEWGPVNKQLKEKKITLMSAGLDEVPMVYKDIQKVMAAQTDLVETLGRFEPRIVKMAPHGERPED